MMCDKNGASTFQQVSGFSSPGVDKAVSSDFAMLVALSARGYTVYPWEAAWGANKTPGAGWGIEVPRIIPAGEIHGALAASQKCA